MATTFPPALDSYRDAQLSGIWSMLVHRAEAAPFNLVATGIFLLAILHIFLAPQISHWAHLKRSRLGKRSRLVKALHLLGEVEIVFVLWAVPLALALAVARGPWIAAHYFAGTVDYTQALFVLVIMVVAASRPIVQLVIGLLGCLAGRSPVRWWAILLTVVPLLGSLITEPAAMTIGAVLLGREFYAFRPSARFAYATLGLLFVNISVGGALTSFAAPPILMVAAKWDWSTAYMLGHFGLRVVPGILVGNLVYFLIFRREFESMEGAAKGVSKGEDTRAVPVWITAVHVAFLIWTVWAAREPAWFLAGLVAFLAFSAATWRHQERVEWRAPLLVGLFLAGLVIHGGLQAWWIEPVLTHLRRWPLLVGATVLTAFNDNAAITYLATLVPGLEERFREAVVSGAICGGGLTVIANAPNPAGQAILAKYFPDGISPAGLFLAALGPTLVLLVFLSL
jgi:hypothetical protein